MKSTVKQYILILIGSLIMSYGYCAFLIPHAVASGGAGGVATILNAKFGINVSLVVLIVNAVLFALSWSVVPKSVFYRSLAGTLFLTLFLRLMERVPLFTDDILMASIFGGIIIGVGVGLVIKCGASTGGSDFLAVILNKLIPHISVADFILLVDGSIVIAGGLVMGDYTLMLYAAASAYVTSKLADVIVDGGKSARSIYIISEKSQEISERILATLNRGVTGLYGKGMYTGNDTTVVMCVVKRNQIPKVRAIVNEIDDKAFIILSEVREVLGEGF